MEDMTLCSPEHQAVFQRVWQRVMEGQSGQDSPVEVELTGVVEERVDGDMPCSYLAQLAQAAQAAQSQPSADRRGSDLPPAGEEPQQCGECTARLRQQIMDALEGWQFYRHLARRTRGTTARTLTSMAADQHQQARQLAAAYFLLTGLRYWPTELLAVPAISSFWGALRQRHQAEQQAELSYRMSADALDDPTLLELYEQLATGCQNRCRQLRTLLEQSCT